MEEDGMTAHGDAEHAPSLGDEGPRQPRRYGRAGFLKGVASVGIGSAVATRMLAACSDGGTETSIADGAAPASGTDAVTPKISAEYKNKKIGFAILTSADEDILAIVDWAKEAAKSAGLDR